MEGNTRRMRYNQVSWCPDAFEDDFEGTFVPSAATARLKVKLCFSALQDFTGTVWLPLNSNVRFDGSSKRMGVSSIL